MKRLVVTTESDAQAELLIRLANELHLKVELIAEEVEESLSVLKLAESSFSKEWSSSEDDHWDEFLKKAQDVQSR
jgi:hypothetical protein